MWIDCAILIIGGIEWVSENALVIHGEIVRGQERSAVAVLVGELNGVKFAVAVVDFAGEVSDQHHRHILRLVGGTVFVLVVGALGRHAHVMRVEKLLNPPCLFHRQAGSFHLVLLLVLLVVERGDAVGDGD